MERPQLFLSREEKFAILRAITFPEVTPTMNRHLHSLFEQLELCGSSSGCRPRIEVLAARMMLSYRTVVRVMNAARDLGVLTTSQRQTSGGRQSNDYYVDWYKLRALAAPAKQPAPTTPVDAKPKCQVVTSMCQVDLSIGQVGTALNKEVDPSLDPEIDPPPPTPSNGWGAAAADLVALGIEHPSTCLSRARKSGLSIDDVQAIIAHFRSHAQANGWSPAALHYRLRSALPGLPADQGWPKPAPRAIESQQRQQERARAAEASAETSARLQTTQQTYESLETSHGPILDALDLDRQIDLAASISPMLATRVRQQGGATGKTVRLHLLRHLADNPQPKGR